MVYQIKINLKKAKTILLEPCEIQGKFVRFISGKIESDTGKFS